MEFQITMDPFMDFIFRMFIIGANIVVWTVIAQWLIIEIKSWFPEKQNDVEYDLLVDSIKNSNLSVKEARRAADIGSSFERGEITMAEATRAFRRLQMSSQPYEMKFQEAVPHYTILGDGQLVQNVDIPVEPTSTTTYIENEETTDEVNRRRH